jgi:hypothetical protein
MVINERMLHSSDAKTVKVCKQCYTKSALNTCCGQPTVSIQIPSAADLLFEVSLRRYGRTGRTRLTNTFDFTGTQIYVYKHETYRIDARNIKIPICICSLVC